MNHDVALIKAWNASGLPNCPFTPELIVKDVFLEVQFMEIGQTLD